MKNLFPLILFSLAFFLMGCKDKENPTPTPGENVAGTYYQTLTAPDGNEREYIVYVPQSAAGTRKVPVLFMVHGTNQSGQVFYNNAALWNPKADQEGFIVVYPTGLVYCHYDNGVERTTTKWAAGNLGETDVNRGALPLCPGEVLADDLGFFDSMVETIKEDFVVDEKRIYASGFSNGAQMTARLAAQRSEVFAAVAVHAGNLSPFIQATLSPRPLSMIITVGANDTLFTDAVG